MIRALSLVFGLALALTACGPSPSAVGPGGAQVYRISARDANQIPQRTLEALNSLRQAAGRVPVQYSGELASAAAGHSRDMAVQNRPWHWGSDLSSPLDRVARAGYPGAFVGEAVSESYETELQTLAAWAEDPIWRTVLLDPDARDMGIGWHQESSGKIWWTLVTGTQERARLLPTP